MGLKIYKDEIYRAGIYNNWTYKTETYETAIYGAVGPMGPGSVGLWDPWGCGTYGARIRGAVGPMGPGSVGPWDLWGRDPWGRGTYGAGMCGAVGSVGLWDLWGPWGGLWVRPAGDGLSAVGDADAVRSGHSGGVFAAKHPLPQILLLHRLRALCGGMWGSDSPRGHRPTAGPTAGTQTHSGDTHTL